VCVFVNLINFTPSPHPTSAICSLAAFATTGNLSRVLSYLLAIIPS
jgi:hypothetical protein